MSFDRERMARLGWQLQKAHRDATGYDVPLYKCPRCEDTGFLYRRVNGVTAATRCTCRLSKAFSTCDDDKLVRKLDLELQRTETAFLNGTLVPPSKVAEMEYREWEARQEGGR